MIIGSGSSFHNYYVFTKPLTNNIINKTLEWDNWLKNTLNSNKLTKKEKYNQFKNWRKLSPHNLFSHPKTKEEHLIPLHVVLGSCYNNTNKEENDNIVVKSIQEKGNSGLYYSTHIFF